MRKFLATWIISIMLQAGGQLINIPIETPPELGYGQSFSQDLGVTPAHFQPNGGNGVYVLQVSAANPLNNYPGQWEVEFTFGTQSLCDDYKWATGPYVTVTVVCTSPGYLIVDKALPSGGPAQGQHNLVVTWTVNVKGSTNGGWPVKFQNASLTFTPVN